MSWPMLVDPCMDTLMYVIRHMRPLDRREVCALQFSDSEEALAQKLLHRETSWIYAHPDTGEPVYAWGMYMLRPGVWTFWGFSTDRWSDVALRVTRIFRRNLKPWMQSERVHRIDCLSIKEKVDGHRWLKYLGATEEATLYAYGRNREDFKLFVWR